MSNETVTYSLEAVLTRIESKIDSLEKRMNERFDKVEDRLTKVEIGQAELKAELKGDIKVLDEKRRWTSGKRDVRVDGNTPDLISTLLASKSALG